MIHQILVVARFPIEERVAVQEILVPVSLWLVTKVSQKLRKNWAVEKRLLS
jgi:hypothetical protein